MRHDRDSDADTGKDHGFAVHDSFKFQPSFLLKLSARHVQELMQTTRATLEATLSFAPWPCGESLRSSYLGHLNP